MIHRVVEAFRALMRRAIAFICRLKGKEFNDEAYQDALQFVRFLLVGLTGTVVQLAVYYFLVFRFGHEHYLWWNTIAYCACVIDLYFWNRAVVFTGNKTNFGTFLRSCACYGATYAMQQGLLLLFVDVLHFSSVISPLLAMLLSTPANFVLNKLFAFGEKKEEKDV